MALDYTLDFQQGKKALDVPVFPCRTSIMDDTISIEEAAEILEASKRQLYRIVASGQLRSYPGPNRKRVYRREDVLVLKEIRKQDLDLATVAVMARRAEISTRRMERAFKQLLVVTGLDVPTLDLSSEAIISLCMEMKEATNSPVTIASVKKWARVFHAVGEETLEAIEFYTGNQEPWLLFLELGKKIMKESVQLIKSDPIEARHHYQLFEHGLRSARFACVFYVQMKHGKETAFQLFPGVEGNTLSDIASLAATIFKT